MHCHTGPAGVMVRQFFCALPGCLGTLRGRVPTRSAMPAARPAEGMARMRCFKMWALMGMVAVVLWSAAAGPQARADTVEGNLMTPNQFDVYVINITDPVNFFATTATGVTAPLFDTMLWLFDANRIGV